MVDEIDTDTKPPTHPQMTAEVALQLLTKASEERNALVTSKIAAILTQYKCRLVCVHQEIGGVTQPITFRVAPQ